MTNIRRISVHVDESDPGRFHWVLMEEDGDASTWSELEAGTDSYDIWLDALSAGCAALVSYAPDERIGPRLPVRMKTRTPSAERSNEARLGRHSFRVA